MHIASVWTKIENRISDDLSGTVVRHITATAGFMHLDAMHRKLPIAGNDMRTAVAPDTKCDHRRMLKKEQQVGNTASASLFDKRFLQIERLAVRNGPEAAHVESPAPRRADVSSRWRQSTPGVASRRP